MVLLNVNIPVFYVELFWIVFLIFAEKFKHLRIKDIAVVVGSGLASIWVTKVVETSCSDAQNSINDHPNRDIE